MRKSFGPVQALKGVDVLIMPGEVHAIVGENGAGKSTLIGIAAGVLHADAGAHLLRRQVRSERPIRAKCARTASPSSISIRLWRPI